MEGLTEYKPVLMIDNKIVNVDRFNIGQIEEIQDNVCRIELGDRTSIYVKGTLKGLAEYLRLYEILMPGAFR